MNAFGVVGLEVLELEVLELEALELEVLELEVRELEVLELEVPMREARCLSHYMSKKSKREHCANQCRDKTHKLQTNLSRTTTRKKNRCKCLQVSSSPSSWSK